MKKNLLSGLLAGVMAVSLVACGNSESTPAADSTTETAKPATAENSDTFDVEMVGNSFSIEYCNINVDGARDAVDDLAKKGVTVNLTYNASADSSQVDEQINILNQALAKQPNAILIAACDSGALDEQMITARDAGIPVIAYDITFDNAPEGSLTATSASDSILAAGQAADELLKNETVVEKIKAATPENPAVFSVIAPEAEQSKRAASRVKPTEPDRAGKQSAQRSVGDVERELRGIDEAVKSRTSKGRAEQAERRRAEQEAHQRAEAERRAAEEQQRIASRRYIGRDWEFER